MTTKNSKVALALPPKFLLDVAMKKCEQYIPPPVMTIISSLKFTIFITQAKLFGGRT